MTHKDFARNSGTLGRYAVLSELPSGGAAPAEGLQPAQSAAVGYIALMDSHALARECLAHSLNDHNIHLQVIAFGNLQDWQKAKADLGIPAVVLFKPDDSAGADEITEIVRAVSPAAVVVLSDNQEINAVLDVIALGVRGYIPTSVSIEICIQAISLALAGGKFIPASILLNIRSQLGMPPSQQIDVPNLTCRQSAVAEALRCGKANKDIATELSLCESTIKVHIRNIMKKLGATNRTEVACRIGELADAR